MPPAGSLVDRRARSRCAVLLAGLLHAASLYACSLDWTVRSDPNAAPDTGVDAADASAAADGEGDGAMTTDSPPSEGGADCGALASEVARTKAKARECQLAVSGQCTTTVKDECDCDVVVRFAAAVPTTDYVDAVAALRAACGRPACPACPQLPPMGGWGCVQNPRVECFP